MANTDQTTLVMVEGGAFISLELTEDDGTLARLEKVIGGATYVNQEMSELFERTVRGGRFIYCVVFNDVLSQGMATVALIRALAAEGFVTRVPAST